MFVCPECGYTALKNRVITGTNLPVRWACPRCLPARHNVVWLVETSHGLVA